MASCLEAEWSPLLQTFEGQESARDSIAFSQDGHLIISMNVRSIETWNVETGQVQHKLRSQIELNDNVFPIAFSSDRQLIATRTKNSPFLGELEWFTSIGMFGLAKYVKQSSIVLIGLT